MPKFPSGFSTLKTISRRGFIVGLPLFAAGCVTASYDSMSDGGHLIPAVDMTQLDPSVMRTEVTWRGKEKPGVNFRGEAVIGRKEKWPHWTPTENMMEAIPMYRKFAGGMDGGPGNPLGPRALYLYRNGHDTNFRLHGTTEPETIGQPVSSGCIRLFNQDIIDLYNRVPVGAHVVVIS